MFLTAASFSFNHANQFSKQTNSRHGLFSSAFRLMTCAFTLVHTRTLIPFAHTLVHVLMPRALMPFAYAHTHARSYHNHVITIANYERTHTHTFITLTCPLTRTHVLMPRTLIPFAHSHAHARSHHNHVLTIDNYERTHTCAQRHSHFCTGSHYHLSVMHLHR